jgi:nucleoside-diphosphate-sugar epimerase
VDPFTTPVEDDHPLWPDTHYGALKAATEALGSAYTGNSGLCVAALRPTGIYGLVHPLARSKWFDLAQRAFAGAPPVENRWATEVHGADVADAVFRLLDAPAEQVGGRAFNCSDLLLSTNYLYERLLQLSAGSAERVSQPAPPADAVRNPMRSDGLVTLGWRPGGWPRLEQTLQQLAAACAVHSTKQIE